MKYNWSKQYATKTLVIPYDLNSTLQPKALIDSFFDISNGPGVNKDHTQTLMQSFKYNWYEYEENFTYNVIWKHLKI